MRLIRITTTVFLTALLFFLVLPAQVCLAQGANISVGGNIEIDPGGNDSADLSIDGIPAPGVGAFAITLSWDDSVINVDGITAGSGPSGFTIIVGDPSGGSVTISGFGTTTAMTSGTTVASLDISAVGDPGDTTSITVSVSTFVDLDNNPLEYTEIDTLVSINDSYTLTMDTEGNGSVSPSPGSYEYDIDEVVEISADPANGWQFVRWSNNVENRYSPDTTVTMDSDKTVTAYFEEIPAEQIGLTIEIDGNGSTIPVEGLHYYDEDETVSISAIPDEGWVFISWSGDVADPNAAQTTVTLDDEKTITANFTPEIDEEPPVISSVITATVTKTSAEIHWVTDEPGTSQVDYWASPGELTPIDETLVIDHTVFLTDLSPATTYTYKTISQDASGNLSISDEYTFTTLGDPATFTFGDWDISTRAIDDGQEVTIEFSVTNIGDVIGSHQILMLVNGNEESSKDVELEPGISETIVFNVTKTVPGVYLIQVEGSSFQFSVDDLSDSSSAEGFEIDWITAGITAASFILILTAILLLLKRRYHILIRK